MENINDKVTIEIAGNLILNEVLTISTADTELMLADYDKMRDMSVTDSCNLKHKSFKEYLLRKRELIKFIEENSNG